MKLEEIVINGVVGLINHSPIEIVREYLLENLIICLDISVLGYRWKIAMTVVESAR